MELSMEVQTLTPEETLRLFRRYRRERRPADRERLVLRFLPLARHLSRRYGAGSEREDLEQVAALALVKAIDRYDPDRGIAFTSFAVPTILGELKRYFRDRGWTVRVPRALQERAVQVDRAVERLTGELERTPTAQEIATHCDSTVERVLEARTVSSAHRPDSLDRPVGDQEAGSLLELIGSHEPGYERAEDAVDMELRLASLPQREREVLSLRFEQDLTQREIGEQLAISQMHVSRLIRQAIATLQASGPAVGAGRPA
jgi:RNA polymerase sigma-B factor